MAWGLRLADLKLLALNSLRHSGMSVSEIRAAIDMKWEPKWRDYIAQIKGEACAFNTGLEKVRFKRLLPTSAPRGVIAIVHVFGSHFEYGMCKTLKCKFGEITSARTTYVSNNHFTCTAPALDVENRRSVTVSLSVSFDGGKSYIQTGINFTYKDEGRSETAKYNIGWTWLILASFIVCFHNNICSA